MECYVDNDFILGRHDTVKDPYWNSHLHMLTFFSLGIFNLSLGFRNRSRCFRRQEELLAATDVAN